MRQNSGNRRPHSRHNNGRNDRNNGGDSRVRSAAALKHQSFDSNCGELRVKGTAWQVYEKYQVLARDSASSGDRILAENYLQHAEHYYRIMKAIEEAAIAEQGEHRIRREFNKPQTASSEESNGAEGAEEAGTEQSNGEATVQKVAPAIQAGADSPFYTQEEIDEHNRSSEQKAISM
ncbi:MAG: DUF4167 domain-containing protein [Alphaproteobacteria bacterium]|nr:DUF4167 domain-containing protein [Alphaproteobacteria bacterium]